MCSRRPGHSWGRASSWSMPCSGGSGPTSAVATFLPDSPCGAATRIDRMVCGLFLLLVGAGHSLGAQDALSLVGSKTQVKSIEFRFTGKHTLAEADLLK